MSVMTILHLSDIHFRAKGLDTEKSYRQQVSKHMMEAIGAHVNKNQIVPDMVVVTGDIAYSGKEEEYEEAATFFKNLQSILPPETLYLVVPGNHDVDREKVRSFSLHVKVQNQETDQFLKNKEELDFFVNLKFSAFRDFVDKLHPKLYKEEADYFWVKEFEEKSVSFLGLNSCWACENDTDKDNITLGFPQVMGALDQAKMPNRILLMHHPPNWLNEDDFNRYEGEVFKQCPLILHGHTHRDKALVVRNPSHSCICLGANASYTNEKKGGFIGFQFIRVEFCPEGLAVKGWPYRWEYRDSFRFVMDFNRYEGQKGKPYFELETFERATKSVPEPKDILHLEIPKEYKLWVEEFFSTMDIELLARKGEVITVSLPELYIPLETKNPFYEDLESGEIETIEGEAGFMAETVILPEETPKIEESASIDIQALVGRKNRILLRGGAGTGKTTMIKHLAYTVTHDLCPSSLRGYLPVMVFLKDLWLIFQEELQGSKKKVVFEDLLILYLEKIRCPLTWDIISGYLSRQKALFLIDGMDEVPDHLRKELFNIINQFQFKNKENRFLLTSRPHGIADLAASYFDDDFQDIEPLDNPKVKEFIKRWFKAVSYKARGLGEMTAGAMLSDIRQHEHISVFTQNPLLLTAVCILYQVGKRIPEQRADLYNRIIDNLIHRRFHNVAHHGRENEILEFLMHLAYNAQKKNRKTIDKSDALESLRTIFPCRDGERLIQYELRISNLFDEIEQLCGLFNFLSSGEIEFTHLSFQEFLAAKHIVYTGIDWKQYLEKDWWEETLLLYTGFINLDRKRESNAIVEAILEAGKTHKRKRINLRLQFMAGKALCDFQSSKREPQTVTNVRDAIYRLIDSKIKVEDRFQAGVFLGGLRDARIHLDNMVRIPAGEFIRGANNGEDREKPERRIYLDAFEIGVYPVTNQEFKQFIADKGYDREEFWKPEGWQWSLKGKITGPEYWNDFKWNGANFPVMGVSWYEADAYSAWLSKMIGKAYRLPTEAEWEKAARGTDGLEYPWGKKFDKELCNSREAGLGRTGPVGIFPRGKSPYGCFDMAGNIWEWCADWRDDNYYHHSPARNPIGPLYGLERIVRGGGWIGNRWDCRSACRDWSPPISRDDNVGFRLVRSL